MEPNPEKGGQVQGKHLHFLLVPLSFLVLRPISRVASSGRGVGGPCCLEVRGRRRWAKFSNREGVECEGVGDGTGVGDGVLSVGSGVIGPESSVGIASGVEGIAGAD